VDPETGKPLSAAAAVAASKAGDNAVGAEHVDPQVQGVLAANRRSISSSVRWLLSGYRAQTMGMAMTNPGMVQSLGPKGSLVDPETGKPLSAAAAVAASKANRRSISSSVRWLLSGYRAQTMGMAMTLLAAKTYSVFSLAVRARGNAFGVVGWSIGNGWLVSKPP
jgi:hypothetical protein